MWGFGTYLAVWNESFADANCDTSSPTLTPPPNFPPLSGPERAFIFERADYRVAAYTEESRFVLYDNGAFSLQYPNLGGLPYRGSYTEESGLLNFTWEACCGWRATGRLEGDSLKVQYNPMMQLADFENAVYARTP